MRLNVSEETFEHVELFGKPALFLDARIDTNTVPHGFFCYDLRGSDDDPGKAYCMELHVSVNHAGVVLTPEKFPLTKDNFIMLEGELNFLDEELTVEQFCQRYQMEYNPNCLHRSH